MTTPQPQTSAQPDPNRLAPEDALGSRLSSPSDAGPTLSSITASHAQALRRAAALGNGTDNGLDGLKTREQRRKDRSRSRRRKGAWKKLLWVRQSCMSNTKCPHSVLLLRCAINRNLILIANSTLIDPDNYTDEATFLDALQRNPRVRPYEFWPLVADSTVIVQQLCTMIVFVCCFHGIIHSRVSPITVVSWGSFGTVLGWLLWDSWVGQELALNATVEVAGQPDVGPFPISRAVSHRDLQGFAAQQQMHSLGRSVSQRDLHSAAAGGVHGGSSLRSVSQVDLSGSGSNSRHASSTSLAGLGLHYQNHSRRTSNQSFRLTPISEPPLNHGHAHQPHPFSVNNTPTQSPTTLSRPPLFPNASAASLPPMPSHNLNHTGAHTPKPTESTYTYYPPLGSPSSRLSPRTQQRLATAKSATLIYFALLGLSPILKSLTRSTASDSIWALAFWLMSLNLITFDYGAPATSTRAFANSLGRGSDGDVTPAGDIAALPDLPGPGASFPASLSTNAALMASTVLASRLPSTTHVFSLTLFSIEVFGLFPVFRRYLRHISWVGHLWLTWGLVVAAGGGVVMCMTGGGWKAGIAGAVLGTLVMGLAMGACSWWLIGLQRYKNEIYGPWDPARPVIRRWD